MNGLVELKILFLNIMYMNLWAIDSQNSCLLLPYVLWYSSFLLLLSSTKDQYGIRKFFTAKICVNLRFCKFLKVYGIIFRKSSKSFVSLRTRKVCAVLRSKYFVSWRFRKIYAILRRNLSYIYRSVRLTRYYGWNLS